MSLELHPSAKEMFSIAFGSVARHDTFDASVKLVIVTLADIWKEIVYHNMTNMLE